MRRIVAEPSAHLKRSLALQGMFDRVVELPRRVLDFNEGVAFDLWRRGLTAIKDEANTLADEAAEQDK